MDRHSQSVSDIQQLCLDVFVNFMIFPVIRISYLFSNEYGNVVYQH